MAEKEFMTYKGKPMVRCGDTIYYGDTADKYIVMLKINSTVTVDGNEVPDKVTVQLMLSDQEIKKSDRIVKKSEKTGLYNAMDVGCIWLERALKSE
ncbi:MAG: hypothetical protein ACLU40_08690 [Acutalibacteraceae bacterium]|jgi:arginyl-tRNA synthetase